MKFKKLRKDLQSEEFWYDISSGGYIKPSDFSNDKATIKAIEDAVELLMKLEEMINQNMEEAE